MIDHLRDLKPDPRNARRHNPRNVGMLTDALHEVGAARSIVIDETGTVLAGNATIEAAADAGIERVQVVDADGETLIAVRRSGLTDEQKRRLALYDNRVAELAEWDADALLAEMQAGVSLDGLFREEELAELIDALQPHPPQGDPDEIPETPAEPVTKRGDIITLGRHRIYCGDSSTTDARRLLFDGAEAMLLLTDPPYGVDYASLVEGRENQKAGGWDDIHNDALSDDELQSLLTATLDGQGAHTAFVWHPAGARRFLFWRALEANGWRIAQEIVWVKNALVFGRADYQWRHEPCLYAKRKGAPRQEDRTQTTVWEENKPSDSQHPTQKPVELFARPIRNHTTTGDIIFDPFLGSGTALVAAEQEGRTCYGIELEPRYVDVCIERYQRYTGQTVERAA